MRHGIAIFFIIGMLLLTSACSNSGGPEKPVLHLFTDAGKISGTGTIADSPDGQEPVSRLTYPHDDALWVTEWQGKQALRFESTVLGDLRGSLHLFHRPAPAPDFEITLSSWLETEMEPAWSGVIFGMESIHSAVGVRWKADGIRNQLSAQVFTYNTPELSPVASKTFSIDASRWANIRIKVGYGAVALQIDSLEPFGAQVPTDYYRGNSFGLYQGEGTGYFSNIRLKGTMEESSMDDLFAVWNMEMVNTAKVVLMKHFAKPEENLGLPVPVRRVPLANEWRSVVPVQSHSELEFTFDVPHNAQVHLGFGLLPAFALSEATGEIEIAIRSGENETLLHRESFQPRMEPPRWFRYHDFSFDLSPYGGTSIDLILRFTSPGNQETLVGCWSEPLVAVKHESVKPNVLLLVIDTLRSDRLGSYGNKDDLSPNLDRFAQTGTVFLNTISQAPWTLPSHASLFTGLFPSETGCDNAANKGNVLQEGFVTWAELFQQRGYNTIGLTSGIQVRGEIGFNQGFDRYQDIEYEMSYSYEAVQERFRHWLDRHEGEPWFAFMQTYAVHFPYKHHQYENYRTVMRSWQDRMMHDQDTYDGGVRFIDEWFGVLLDELSERKILGNTIIIVTSDHGEDLGERGMPRPAHHGHTLYDELLKVPLIISYPKDLPKNKRVQKQVRLLDVLPTVLETAGLETPAWCHGKSLLPLMNGRSEPGERIALSEAMTYGVKLVSLRTQDYKLIHKPDPDARLDETSTRIPVPSVPDFQLFNLKNDPHEQVNLAETMPNKLDELMKALSLLRQTSYPASFFTQDENARDAPQPSAALIEELRSMGYMSN